MADFLLQSERYTLRHTYSESGSTFPAPAITTRSIYPANMPRVRSWVLEWSLLQSAEIDQLKQVFAETAGGAAAMRFQPPGELLLIDVRFRAATLRITHRTKTLAAVSVELEAVRPQS